MKRQEVEPLVREVLYEIALAPSAKEAPIATALEDLGLTSVGMIELIYRLEERLGVHLHDDDVSRANFSTIGSLVAMLEPKCSV